MTELSARADPIVALVYATRAEGQGLAGALLVAGCAHLIAVLALPHFASHDPNVRRPTTEIVDIQIPKPPPSQPQPPLPLAAERAPPPLSRRTVLKREFPALPPLAQAARLPTAIEDDPAKPLDLTSTFVTASAPSYAVGTTVATGPSPNGIEAAAAPSVTRTEGGALTGAIAAPLAASPDRSRRPSLIGSSDWKCPFPSEADADQIDRAVATILVDVDRAGRTTGVTILQDPGHGFGREARRCAMEKAWSAAVDRNGTAIGDSLTINVRFER